jgi:DNA-directed RNA polymerase subunit H
MVSKAKTPKKQVAVAKKKVAKKSKITKKKPVKKAKTSVKKVVKKVKKPVKKAKAPVKKGLEQKKKIKEEEKKPTMKPIFEHVLVPKHRLMTDEEKQALLKKYKIGLNQLPRISSDDPVLKLIKDFKPGDILEIERDSITAGKTMYYRVIA